MQATLAGPANGGVMGEINWSLSSKKDPRWNCKGGGWTGGVLGGSPQLEAKVKQLKAEYGEPPDDLRIFCGKGAD